MITLFRRIRQKLINSGSVTKYLLYAMGEILLVVFGILIAIQINTAFDNRIKSENHQRLVNDLQSEFEGNLDQLNTVIRYHQLVHASSIRLLEFISTEGQGTTQDEMRKLLFENGHRWTFDPLNGVLASGMSSGDIHLLKNDSLKVLLFSWEDLVLDAREEQTLSNTDYMRIRNYLENNIMTADLLMHDPTAYGARESHYESNYLDILKDREYENLLSFRVINTVDVLNELEPLKEINEQILEFLERELTDGEK